MEKLSSEKGKKSCEKQVDEREAAFREFSALIAVSEGKQEGPCSGNYSRVFLNRL